MKPSRDAQIAAILAAFRFDRIHTAMTALHWEWLGKGVPTVAQLADEARRLLSEVKKGRMHSCGGFEATNDRGVLTLSFVLDYASGEDAPCS